MRRVNDELIDVLRPCKRNRIWISVAPGNMHLFSAFDFAPVADKRQRKFRHEPIRFNPNFDLQAWKAKVRAA
jgi:hypothetical protein